MDQVYYEENGLARPGAELRLETGTDGAAIKAPVLEVVVIAGPRRVRR